MISLPVRYVVKKPLDGGGMSDTVVCKDMNVDRDVVVKSLKAGIERHRLIDELSSLSNIRSKYVVQVLDVIREKGEVVGFVEEYINGDDLAPFPADVDEAEALRVLYSIISGIDEIHAHGRVHRDVKPENMKIDKSGTLKIFDFGLAKMTANAKTKQLFYTPFYSAPEVFIPDPAGIHNFTPAVDIFAFGATAFWLLNGGKLGQELQSVPPVVSDQPTSFDQSAVQLSTGITALLNRSLSANPRLRPTAQELRAAIQRQLLFDKHRMLLTHGGLDHFIDAAKRKVKLTAGSDSVTIAYNGMDFMVVDFSGHVRHNNRQVMTGYALRGASVIVLGNPAERVRTSITADVSHPEVMN